MQLGLDRGGTDDVLYAPTTQLGPWAVAGKSMPTCRIATLDGLGTCWLVTCMLGMRSPICLRDGRFGGGGGGIYRVLLVPDLILGVERLIYYVPRFNHVA